MSVDEQYEAEMARSQAMYEADIARITRLKVYQDGDRVVNGAGQIVREDTYWCVECTESHPGYVDVDYRAVFGEELSAWAHVEGLKREFHIPAEVLARAAQ